MTQFDSLITVAQCFALIDGLQDTTPGQADSFTPPLILDCRANLADPAWGQTVYQQAHIPGAIHADLEQDLSVSLDDISTDASTGASTGASTNAATHGRHPLPTRQQWQLTLRRWGLQAGQQVIAYDDAGGAFAARAWWMLRWAGHAAVAVLDGGLPAWQHAYPQHLHSGAAQPVTPSEFNLDTPLAAVITADAVLSTITDQHPDRPQLLDARSEERWAGKVEPIDPVAGHIPGALCLPFQNNLNEQGFFKSAAELADRFAAVMQDDSCICYCGSGVTAAHNLLALHIAGYQGGVLYADSWSGWISDPNRPIERRP